MYFLKTQLFHYVLLPEVETNSQATFWGDFGLLLKPNN